MEGRSREARGEDWDKRITPRRWGKRTTLTLSRVVERGNFGSEAPWGLHVRGGAGRSNKGRQTGEEVEADGWARGKYRCEALR